MQSKQNNNNNNNRNHHENKERLYSVNTVPIYSSTLQSKQQQPKWKLLGGKVSSKIGFLCHVDGRSAFLMKSLKCIYIELAQEMFFF